MLPKGQALVQENRILKTQIFSAFNESDPFTWRKNTIFRGKRRKIFHDLSIFSKLNAFYNFTSYNINKLYVYVHVTFIFLFISRKKLYACMTTSYNMKYMDKKY